MRTRHWLAALGTSFLFGSMATACSSSSDQDVPGDGGGTDASPGGDGTTLNDAATSDVTDAKTDASPYQKLPCDVSVGTGSGTIDISDAVGKAGDVICLKAGSYSGGSIKNLSNRTVQNDGGQVVITGIVEIGNLLDVTFSGAGDAATPYGFQLNGAAASMVITAANTNLTVHDFEGIGAGIMFDGGHSNVFWSGADGGAPVDGGDGNTGFILYKSRLDRIHLKSSGLLLQGNYGALSLYVNFASDVEMSNVIVEDSHAQGHVVVEGGGFFNLNVHDWTITDQNDVTEGSTDDRDVGVFTIVGNGTFRRIHRDGGWGWLVRTFGAALSPTPGEYHCENNVDLNTEYYGTCEIRNEDSPSYLVPGVISTVQIFIADNVSAHKRDLKGGYTTAIGLIPNLKAGTTATLTNNTGCDNTNDYADMNSMHFFEVDGTVVNTGNQQLTSCTGVKDPITGNPL